MTDGAFMPLEDPRKASSGNVDSQAMRFWDGSVILYLRFRESITQGKVFNNSFLQSRVEAFLR